MNVVGMDLSVTGSAVATGHGVKRLRTAKSATMGGMLRYKYIRDNMLLVASLQDGPTVVYVEGYSYGSKGRAVVDQGELGGIVRVALYDNGIPYVDVPPPTLKVFATGRGNANKVDMVIAARDRLGYTGNDDNEADALWLRALGMQATGQPLLALPKTHLRALEKLPMPVRQS